MKKKLIALFMSVVVVLSFTGTPYAKCVALANTEIYPPSCDQNCNTDTVGAHSDRCTVKVHYKNLFDTSSAEELYDLWGNLPKDAQDYILNIYAWTDQTKRAKLVKLLENGTVEPEGVNAAIQKLKSAKAKNQYDELLSGIDQVTKDAITNAQWQELHEFREALPSYGATANVEYNGMPLSVDVIGEIPSTAKVEVKPVIGENLINVGLSFGKEHMLMVFDVTIYDNNKEWQPESGNPITISFKVDAFGLEDGKSVTVHHKHADEDPIISKHIIENGYVNYKTDKLSPVALAAADYPLYPLSYNENKLLYWDVSVPTGSGFPTHKRGDASRVASVSFNGIKVAKGNSSGKSPNEWGIETASSLSSYYPGTRVGSESDIQSVTIKPVAGYYVSGITVACTAYQPEKWYGLVIMHDAYNCGTWRTGNEFTRSLNYESYGEVTIEIPSIAFCHMSNNMENIYIDNDNGKIPQPGGTNQYFILIEVTPIPSPLYVEYQCGDIVNRITNSTQKSVFTGSANWVTIDSRNDGTRTVETANTQTKYYYDAGLDQSQQAAEAAKWKHYAGYISSEALAAAAAAGYEFNGWVATYYNTCISSKITPNPNNYNYSFSSQIGAAVDFAPGDQVNLYTHVILVAQWKKSDKPLTGSITVQKRVEAPSGVNLTGVSYPAILKIEGTPYNGFAKRNGQTVMIQNGILSLSNNDVYVVEGVLLGAKYSISENISDVAAPNGYEYKQPSYKVGSAIATNTAPENKQLTENTTILITNVLQGTFGDLLISKTGIQEVDHHEKKDDFNLEEKQSTIYRILGNGLDMEVVILGNGSVLIKDLPFGNYTVTEIQSWSWRYNAENPIKEVTVTAGKTAEATFTNTREHKYWLSGDNHCLNWWKSNTEVVRKDKH